MLRRAQYDRFVKRDESESFNLKPVTTTWFQCAKTEITIRIRSNKSHPVSIQLGKGHEGPICDQYAARILLGKFV